MLNAFLVALVVFICVGGAELIGFTMLNRPIVIGPLVGLFLGDLHTGVMIGASLEAVFMGVVNGNRQKFLAFEGCLFGKIKRLSDGFFPDRSRL